MAEAVLGVVSAGAGLLSLTIQLAESIQKLRSFQNKVKNASDTLADLILELEFMGHSLDVVERYKSHNTMEAGLVAHCVARCRTTTERIQNIVDRLHDVGTKRARLGKFYVAVKDPEIMKLLQELDQARGSLAVSLLMFYSERQRQSSEIQHATLQRRLMQLEDIVQHGFMQVDNIWAHTQANSITLATVSRFSNLCPHDRDQEAQSTTNFTTRPEPGSSDPGQTKNQQHTKGKRSSGEILVSIRLPKLLFSQAWHVSVVRTSLGFKVNLCAYMGRDPFSEIFLRCATGNTRAVQKLIDEGKACLRDVSEGGVLVEPLVFRSASFNLLQVREQSNILTVGRLSSQQIAICFGHVDLFKWLWQEFRGQGIDSNGLVDALLWDSSSQPADTILRTCLDEVEIDLSAYSGSYNVVSVASLQDRPLQLLLDYQTPSLTALERFKVVSRINRFMAAETFIQLMGTTQWTPELSTLEHQGFSVLHFAATMLAIAAPLPRDSYSTAFADWIAIAVTSLRHGAQPSQIARSSDDYSGLLTTPFLELVSRMYEIKNIYGRHFYRQTTIQSWLGAIQDAGFDIYVYGQQEQIAWRKCQESLPSNVDQFHFAHGQEPWQWDISVAESRSVPHWRLEEMPCTFPLDPYKLNPYIPKDISWEPEDCDWRGSDKHSWRHVDDKTSRCKPRSVVEAVEADWRDWMKAPKISIDDGAMIVMMAHQRPRPVTSKTRSASVPPSKYGHRSNELKSYNRFPFSWGRHIHFCIATMSYEYGWFHSVRYCMNGCFHEEKDADTIQTTNWWNSHSFLAEICNCKDGWASDRDTPNDPRFPRHTGSRDCPQGCSKVRVEELQVPQEFRMFHPKRQADERWDEP